MFPLPVTVRICRRTARCYAEPVARVAGILALVLLLLLLAIPLGIGMAMGPCPDCVASPLMPTVAACIAVLLAVGGLIAPSLGGIFRSRSDRWRPLLLTRDLDPPPRSL